MNSGVDLAFILRIAKRRLPLFLTPLVIVAALGTAVVMYLPAIYTSSAKILVESQQIPDDFVKSTVTALATERLQVIQQRVLTRENLLTIAGKFELFSARKGLSRTDLTELMHNRITFQLLDLGLSNRRSRKEDNLTVVFSVGFDYERPDIAAKVANELVTIVLNEDIQSRTLRAAETTNFIDQENKRIAQDLQEVDGTLATFKLEHSNTLPEKLAFNMSLLERQQRLIAEIDRDVRSAEESKRQLQFEARILRAQVSLGSPEGQTLEQQLISLRNDYALRSAVYSENHPEMRALRKLIAAKAQALQNAEAEAPKDKEAEGTSPDLSPEGRILAEKIAAIDRSIGLLTKQRQDLLASTDKLQEIILQTPQVGAELAALERRREALQRSSDDMAAKLSLAKLGERLEANQQAERFEVIESPIIPQEPSRPKRLPLLILVAFASLGVGGAAAFGAEFLDSTVKRSVDLTAKMNQHVLTVIPYIYTRAEIRRRRLRLVVVVVGVLLLAALCLAGVHLFYAPLDLLSLQAVNSLKSVLN